MKKHRRALTADQVRALIRAQTILDGDLLTIADKAGVSPSYVCMVLSKHKAPSDKLANAVGLRKVVMYVPR